MKIILCFVLVCLGATSAFSAERLDAAAWRNVQTYDVATLKNIEEMRIQKVVGVHFHYRGKKLRHIKPNWYEASIWQRTPAEKKAFAFLRVLVAKKDVPAFETITTDFRSPNDLLVYGRVLKDADAHYLFIHLLGRKATLDPAGNAILDW